MKENKFIEIVLFLIEIFVYSVLLLIFIYYFKINYLKPCYLFNEGKETSCEIYPTFLCRGIINKNNDTCEEIKPVHLSIYKDEIDLHSYYKEMYFAYNNTNDFIVTSFNTCIKYNLNMINIGQYCHVMEFQSGYNLLNGIKVHKDYSLELSTYIQ